MAKKVASKKKATKKRGRKPQYDREKLFEEILDRIAHGEPLKQICRTEGFPSSSTVFDWLKDSKEFTDRYAQARLRQYEVWADEIITIAHEQPSLVLNKAGSPSIDSAWVQLQRLKVDSRKWLLSKLCRARYGGDSEQPQDQAEIGETVDKPKDETREEWLKRQKSKG